MGGCASTEKTKSLFSGRKPGDKPVTQVIKVIHVDGRVKEFNPPICAAQILFHNSGCILCSSDSMLIDFCPAHVPESEELKPGLYFLLPKYLARNPLTLEDLCELAIKASSNLSIDDLQLSFRHYAI